MRRQISLTHQVADALGGAIVSGRFEHKTFPSENELSLDFGASRTVVREAIKILIGKGLVSTRPFWGATVEAQTRWSLLDRDVLRWMTLEAVTPRLLSALIDLRAGIEPAAVSFAARYADAQDRAIIISAVQRLADPNQAETQTIAAMAALQTALLEATKNPFYIGLAPVLRTALEICARDRTLEQLADDAAWQQEAAEAVVVGDVAAARATAEKGLLGSSAGRPA